MKTLQHILNKKGGQVFSVTPDSTVLEALQVMADKDVGALLVLDGRELAGIFSERDYARKVKLFGKNSAELKVKDIMSPDIITITMDKNIEECMSLMSSKKIRHLPVVDGEKLLGVISIGDIVKAVIEEKQVVIDELMQYISGSI
ncbi:MAG: CBS domain-containing protein [Ignavibacteriales bacterium]|nr:CBS domain-containing protein [Ignavibacteriales bacterium]MCF8306290.1 CBS domain-containing protein [Ignavibacteriales bacterium]MCF8316011.1 CBS domain-containing protein [Ignavibacteriales bacterium]MCF8437605.1 CBS domain-containing protein [Ignavibacteriales bacterium]